MNELSRSIVEFLVAFVKAVFIKEYADLSSTALLSLKALFLSEAFTLCTEQGGKGQKTASHNSRERFYVRVTKAGIAAPLVLKPRFFDAGKDAKGKEVKGLHGYFVNIDIDNLKAKADFEAFLKAFDPDTIPKGGTVDDAILTLAARQKNEDIGNNYARKASDAIEAAEKAAKEAQERAKDWIALPDSIWKVTRPELLKKNPDLVAIIDAARQPKA